MALHEAGTEEATFYRVADSAMDCPDSCGMLRADGSPKPTAVAGSLALAPTVSKPQPDASGKLLNTIS
jgi:hypothetical protein